MMKHKLSEAHFKWLMDRPGLLDKMKFTKEETHKIYEIHNETFGKSQKPGGCGRCLANIRNSIKDIFNKQRDDFRPF